MRSALPWCYNARAVVPMTERAQFLGQIEKLFASHTLHGSESLCKLLRYLANYSLDQPGKIPKEYQIATEVFGRQQDFDPHLDSMVRVQVGRLRAKLTEYYGSEGADDSIFVEMPKGNYVLTFHQRSPGAGRDHAASTHDTSDALPDTGQPSRKWFAAIIVVSVFLAAIVAVATDRFLTRKTAEARLTGDNSDAPLTFHVFWKRFLTGPQEPWVIFSIAAFVARRYIAIGSYNRAKDSGAAISDHYTGVGEVLAVHALDNVFGKLHQQIRVKRGSLFSLDDAQNNHLLFIASPLATFILFSFPTTPTI